MPPRATKEKSPPGPDELVRESAGAYRSGDGRFRVQKSDAGWYLVDMEQANEFGQQLMHGPLPTLDAIRDAIPGARDIKPLLRNRRPPRRSGAGSMSAKQVAASRPTPAKTWIDDLPGKEADNARRLIRVLEKEGLRDAEGVVRRFRDQPTTLATRIAEQRLRALVDEQPESDRERAQHLVRRTAEILTAEGAAISAPGPRWALVAFDADEDPPDGRIRPQV